MQTDRKWNGEWYRLIQWIFPVLISLNSNNFLAKSMSQFHYPWYEDAFNLMEIVKHEDGHGFEVRKYLRRVEDFLTRFWILIHVEYYWWESRHFLFYQRTEKTHDTRVIPKAPWIISGIRIFSVFGHRSMHVIVGRFFFGWWSHVIKRACSAAYFIIGWEARSAYLTPMLLKALTVVDATGGDWIGRRFSPLASGSRFKLCIATLESNPQMLRNFLLLLTLNMLCLVDFCAVQLSTKFKFE